MTLLDYSQYQDYQYQTKLLLVGMLNLYFFSKFEFRPLKF